MKKRAVFFRYFSTDKISFLLLGILISFAACASPNTPDDTPSDPLWRQGTSFFLKTMGIPPFSNTFATSAKKTEDVDPDYEDRMRQASLSSAREYIRAQNLILAEVLEENRLLFANIETMSKEIHVLNEKEQANKKLIKYLEKKLGNKNEQYLSLQDMASDPLSTINEKHLKCVCDHAYKKKNEGLTDLELKDYMITYLTQYTCDFSPVQIEALLSYLDLSTHKI